MSEDEEAGSLASLDRRLATARQAREKKPSGGASSYKELDSFAETAFRMGAGLIASIAVAPLIGWALDRWLGTWPWLMITFFVVGAAIGLLNVVRTARMTAFGPNTLDKNDRGFA